MPEANLPTSMTGWLVAFGAGIVGFLAGFVFITACNRVL
jgi:hypothetical protein